eukprot:gene14094-10070_t
MSDMAPMHEASSSAVGSKKLSKAKIFRNAMTFSKLHYTDDVEVQYPIDAMEFLSVKQFDAEYVLQHLEHIRHLIDIENIDLERAIEDLQRIINGEDIQSAEVTPRGSRDHTTTTALSSTSASSSSSSSLARASRPIPDVRFSQTLNSATLLKAKDNNPNHSRSHSSHSSHSSHANHHPSQPKMTKTVSLSSSSASSGMHRSSSMPNDVSFLADLDDPSVRPMSQPTFNNNSNNNNQTKSAESSPQQPQQQSSTTTVTTSRVSKFRGRLRDAQAELFLADDL